MSNTMREATLVSVSSEERPAYMWIAGWSDCKFTCKLICVWVECTGTTATGKEVKLG